MSLTAAMPRAIMPPDDDAMIPVCPKCDVGLFILHLQDIEVDFCQRCRGLWLDAGELEAIIAQSGVTADAALLAFLKQDGAVPRGRPHLCPRCDQPLQEIVVTSSGAADLTLDRCGRGHGLWFDADELPQLLARFPQGADAGPMIAHLKNLFGNPQPSTQEK